MAGTFPNERILKSSILQFLREQKAIDASTTIASEFVLGRSRCRADLAVFNGEFVGFEIKSRLDGLGRLQKQLAAYAACFDRVVVVADQTHIPRILQSASDAVEIWQVTDAGHLKLVRHGVHSAPRQCSMTQLQLLKLPELRRLAGVKEKMSRSALAALAMEKPRIEIRNAAVRSFQAAFSDVSRAFWRSVGRRKVSAEHLDALSRYADLRAQHQAQLDARNARLDAWKSMAPAIFGDEVLNQPTPPLLMQAPLQLPEHVSGC